MKRPIESDYISLTAYTRALEEYCDTLAQPEPAIIGTYLEKDKEQEFIKHHGDDEGWLCLVCPDPDGYLMQCCDCGLVHEAEFGVVRYKSETEPAQQHNATSHQLMENAQGDLERINLVQTGVGIVYTTPPQRKPQEFVCSTELCHYRKPLSDEERLAIRTKWMGGNWTCGDIIDAVEAAHNIKENT